MSNKLNTIFIIFFLLNGVLIEVTSKTSITKIRKSDKVKNTEKAFSTTYKSYAQTIVKRTFDYVDLQLHTQIWIKCSDEWGSCRFSGESRMVRFGSSPHYHYKEVRGSIGCNYIVFGDPFPGVEKYCYVRNTVVDWDFCSEENQECKFSGVSIVKFGTENSWNYKLGSESINCNATSFGNPTVLAKKCFKLRDNFWKECAQDGGVCNFIGTTIVKYGYENRVFYRQVTDSIPCNKQIFGDPAPGNNKFCNVRLGSIFWVQCAREGNNCENLPGESIIRFGSNENFIIKSATDSFSCSKEFFNSNIQGDNVCHYAVFNLGDVPNDIQDLKDSIVSNPEEYDEVKEQATCGDPDGFGFAGRCLSQPFGESPKDTPNDVQSSLEPVLSMLTKMLLPIDGCLGDFTGDFIVNNTAVMSDTKCNTIPLMEEFKYGIIALSASGIPCGVNLIDISFCIAFDRCGTVAIVSNAGVFQCAATYSTGIAAVLSPISDMLDYVGFGFSYKRRFTKKFKIAHRSGPNTVVSEVTTFGHFYAKVGFSLPMNDFKVAGKRIKDFFSLDVECFFLVDFGNTFTVLKNMIEKVKTQTTGTANAFLENLLTINAEMTLHIGGKFTIKLRSITQGFLPDIEFNIGSASLLLSSGNGGGSGMSRGIYFHISRGFDNFGDVLTQIINQFSNLFAVFGVKIPKVDIKINLSISLGLFIADDSMGIHISLPGLDISCIYIYGRGGSCNLNMQFLTVILDGLKYVLKWATQLWDTMGKKVLEFAADVNRFVTNAANSVKTFFENDFKNFFERDVKQAFESAGREIQNFFVNQVGKGITQAGQVIKNVFENEVKRELERVVNTVKNALENFFRGW